MSHDTLPDWWKQNRERMLLHLLHSSGHFSEYIIDAMRRGRFLKSSFALQIPCWFGVEIADAEKKELIGQLFHVEQIHAVTCAVDDIIDGDRYRRGQPSFCSRQRIPAVLLTTLYSVLNAAKTETLRQTMIDMVIGEAKDVGILSLEDLPFDCLEEVVKKATPLFGEAFSYVGDYIGIDKKMLYDAGVNLGKYYQWCNDYHDFFSVATKRGDTKEAVPVTYSLVTASAIARGKLDPKVIGTTFERDRIDSWRFSWEGEVQETAKKRLDGIKEQCKGFCRHSEYISVIDLFDTKEFWDYEYNE